MTRHTKSLIQFSLLSGLIVTSFQVRQHRLLLACAQIHENLCKHMQIHVCFSVSRIVGTCTERQWPKSREEGWKIEISAFLKSFCWCQLFKHSRSASGNPTEAASGAQGSGCSDLRALPFTSLPILLENSTCARRESSKMQKHSSE